MPCFGFNFVTQKSAEKLTWHFQTLRILAFVFKVASKPFSKMVPIIRFWFNKFSSFVWHSQKMFLSRIVRQILKNFSIEACRECFRKMVYIFQMKKCFECFKIVFLFFYKKSFLVTNLRPFSGKARQTLEHCLTQKVCHR